MKLAVFLAVTAAAALLAGGAALLLRTRRSTRLLQLQLAMLIGERDRAEARLRESEKRFKTIAEESPAGIFILQDGRFAYANTRFAEIFGYKVDDVLRCSGPIALIHPDDWSDANRQISSELSSPGQHFDYECRGITKGGRVLSLRCLGSHFLHDGRPAVLGTLLDLSTWKHAERERNRTRNIESIGQLAGGIAHDFNNLLTVIIGHVAMAREAMPNDSRVAPMLETAERVSFQAAALATKLISFGRGDYILRKEVPLQRLLDAIRQSSILDDSYPLAVALPAAVFSIWGDEARLGEVLSNLILNAREAMPSGGTITFSAENVTVGEESALGLQPGRYVHLAVSDRGVGIAEEHFEKIFDPYFSTKGLGAQKGLGMGLPICYSIVKKHGGHIGVSSTLGKGTSVDVYLPAHDGLRPA